MAETEVENWLQKSINQLDIVGMYTKDRFKSVRLNTSITILAMFCVTSTLDFILNCDTLEKYVESLTSFLPTFASLLFLFCFISNRHILYEVVGILRNNFEVHHHSIQGEIMGLRLVKYSQYFLYNVLFLYILLCIQSYFEREGGGIHDAKGNGLPGRSYYPMDLTKPYYFALGLFQQLMTIAIVIHITIPIAICFSCLLIHLRAQVFYLQECLIQVCENQDPETRRAMLNKCLELHILLIHFTETMQRAFGTILSIHNYSPSIVISVVAYQASMMPVFSPKFLPYVSCVNYVLAECFVYCYYGQQIIDQSELLGFIAYSNKWYNAQPDVGRDLSMIVMRCQHPLRMKFMGSTSASLETYYNIVKTGYSYFMFLASMGAPNET